MAMTADEITERVASMTALREPGPITEVTKFALIVHYGFNMNNTGYAEWMDARLVPGRTLSVLPKGRRSHGHFLAGGRVLVMK